MRRFLHKHHSPIAIEIQPSHLVAVQLVRDVDGWKPRVQATIRRNDGSQSTMPSDAEWAALEDAITRQGAIGREIALLAPSGSTCVEFVELPPKKAGAPIDELARAEIARLARWDDETDFQLQCWDVPPPLRRAADGQAPCSLGIAALPDSASMEIIDALDARGWSVVSIVPGPLAATKSVALSGVSLVIEISSNYSALTVIRESIPLYHRRLPDNGFAFLVRGLIAELHLTETDAISAIELGTLDLNDIGSRAQSLCKSFADSLALEIDATIEFCLRRYGELSIQRLKLVGQGANIVGLAESLRARFEINEICSRKFVAPAHELAASTAIWSAQEKSSHGLLPIIQREMITRQRTAQRWIVGITSVAVIGISLLASLYLSVLSSTASPESRIQTIAREQLQLDAQKTRMSQSLMQARAIGDFQNRILHQPDPSTLLKLFGQIFDESTALTELSVNAPTTPNTFQQIRMAGSASDGARLNEQVSSLRALDIFANVQLLRTSRNATGDGVSFEMTLDLVAPVGAKAKS